MYKALQLCYLKQNVEVKGESPGSYIKCQQFAVVTVQMEKLLYKAYRFVPKPLPAFQLFTMSMDIETWGQ